MSVNRKAMDRSKGVEFWFPVAAKILQAATEVCLIIIFVSACSQEPQTKEVAPAKQDVLSDEQVATFARRYDCVLLSEEIRKAAGTGEALTFNIQRVLNSNKKFIAKSRLIDLIQSGEQMKAVFEISDLDLGLWSLSSPRKCVAELECPADLIPILVAKQHEDLCIAFEPSENHHTLNVTTHADGDDDSIIVSGVVTVAGKLIAIADDGVPAK